MEEWGEKRSMVAAADWGIVEMKCEKGRVVMDKKIEQLMMMTIDFW